MFSIGIILPLKALLSVLQNYTYIAVYDNAHLLLDYRPIPDNCYKSHNA